MFKSVQSINQKSSLSFSIAFTLTVMASSLMAETVKPATTTAPAHTNAANAPGKPITKDTVLAPATTKAPTTAGPSDKTSSSSTEVTKSESGSKKTCDDLKSDIEAKIKAKGVKTFSLDIVDAAEVKDAKVVGSCEAGKKKITYKR